MIDAVSDACLSLEIYNNIKMIPFKKLIDESLLPYTPFYKYMLYRRGLCRFIYLIQSSLFQPNLIIIIHIIQ